MFHVDLDNNDIFELEIYVSKFVNGIVDSLPPGLLEGRPAGNSFLLTSHQLQQLQQQLQVATASQQHQQTEQVATASGGLTLALHHSAGGGAGVLAPQLLLTSQTTPSFAAYPVTAGTQHTTSIQQVLQHHVRQSSILQSTIQQVGSQQTQQSFTETSNGIINGSSKCIPVSPASPFSSRSLTPSPQQRVLTPQPVFHQVMSAAGPVLQLYQPATRTATVATAAITPQPKNKPPQQILPKPISNIVTQTALKPPPPQPSPAGTYLLNQMIPNAGVIVGQQTSSGVQFILRSPSPQTISASVPKAQVVSSNGTLSTQPNAVFVQANRASPPQMVRLITGQSLQLQQVQTSSGPAFVAVPSIQPTLQHTSSTQSASVVPSVATVPIQTSVISQNVIKKTNNINNTYTGNQISNNSNLHYKKKKRKEEETTKLDLANLIKISGIDEEDVAFPPPTISTSPSLSSSVSSLSSASSVSLSPPASSVLPTSSPPVITQSQQIRFEAPQMSQFNVHPEQSTLFQQHQSVQQKSLSQQQSPHIVSSSATTLNQTNTAPLLTSLQTSTAQQTGLRFSIGEDGNVIIHQPQITSQSVTANVAATAQTQLAQLVAEHGGHILQTAVLSLTGSESIVLKTPSGFSIRQPSMMLQRTSTTPNVVLTSDSTNMANGVRILTDVGGINGLAGKVQIVSGSTMQDHNSVHIVAGVPNPGAMSLTEQQQRLQFVTAGVPDISSMSLTTEQQKHVILTNVPNSAAEVSLTEQQQNRMEIVSSVPTNTTTVNEQKSSIQVIPNTRTVSLTEQLVSDISQQILTTNVPNSSNIHEQNTRLIFQNNTERNNEHVRISSSERTDVHITANALPEAIANQQTKLQMIAGLPQNCAISLNQIIPGTEYSITGDKSQIDELQKLKHVQLETAEIQQHGAPVDGQRFRVVSNLEEQQQFMQVNEEQNSIIVEHQRVLNTSTMSFNDQQNRLHVVSSNSSSTDQQRLLQQLEEQQRKILIAQIPQQQRIMQLNEQRNKMTVKSVENFQEQLQQSVLQQQAPQLQQQQQQLLHRQLSVLGTNQNQTPSQIQTTQRQLKQLNVTLKDSGVQKLNMPCVIDEFQEKSIDTVRSDIVGNDDAKSNQNSTHRLSTDGSKLRCSTFEGRPQNVNGVHQTYNRSSSRSNIACSPSSVISPRCSPSPHRSPLHQSPQSPAAMPVQNMISTCFTNRPNLTVVTQSSPSINLNQNPEPSPITHVQNKPCGAAVICNSIPQGGGIEIGKKLNFGQADSCCGDGFTTPPSSTPHNGPLLNDTTTLNNMIQVSSPSTSNQQNSFLETITQTHPNISINKTGIVQPCSKANVMRGKKPKKSAVVKPMVFQSEDKEKNNDGPACLNPVSSDGTHSNVVQRVQTIQLTPQKQQNLKVVQSHIAVLSGKKTRTPTEQATLQKLFNEQQEILLSGKIIPTVPGQNTQGLTFVSTPVRLVLPPSTPPSPHAPTTPPTCNKATSPLHVQVGTQTTLDEPVPTSEVPDAPVPASSPPAAAPISCPSPLLPTLAPPTPSISQESIVPLPPAPPRSPTPPPALPPPSPSPPPAPALSPAKRASMIAEQLEIDQRSVSHPDVTSSFTSVSDACKRLLRYHCLDEAVLSEKDLEKADEIFEATAKHLLDKKAQMLQKYSYLLCKESMREVQTSELIMLGRSFLYDEQQLLDQSKNELNANTNPPNTCSTATQVECCPQLPSLDDGLPIAPEGNCSSSLCEFPDLMPSSPPALVDMCGVMLGNAGARTKRGFESDSMPDIGPEMKKHCPDDEEINAQVQNAIDSILNLQRSDPATDEAVRSILPS